MSPDYNHYRLVLRDFLSLDQCKELEFVHKSCCTVGYRPNVFSTTISHLIATNCAHLIMPFVPIRERLKEKLEEFFGCEYELFVEFTGVISWTRGACIGWHSDDNRPYLRQRHFAAVCYLNSYGVEFKGGLFHFQDGEPMTVVPRAGDVIMYTADSRNIHSVDEIIDGERITLTLWFSRDASHDEDAKLVGLLSHASLNYLDRVSKSYLLLPASSNMYWFPPDQAANHQLGFDIRFARIHALCYDLYFSEEGFYSKTNVLPDLSEFQMKPLFLVRENELFTIEFANIMHALQVLQFSHRKGPALVSCMSERETHKMVGGLSESQQVRVGVTRAVFMKDLHLEELIFNRSYDTFEQRSIDWRHVSAATAAWEDYSCKLLTELCMSLPYWRNHQSIFSVPFDSL